MSQIVSLLQELYNTRAWNLFSQIINISQEIRHNRFCIRLMVKVSVTLCLWTVSCSAVLIYFNYKYFSCHPHLHILLSLLILLFCPPSPLSRIFEMLTLHPWQIVLTNIGCMGRMWWGYRVYLIIAVSQAPSSIFIYTCNPTLS